MKSIFVYAILVTSISISLGRHNAKWWPVRRSDDNFRHLFDDIFIDDDSEGDVESCDGEFEEKSHSILRTDDSIDAGTEFIDAPQDITTSDGCRRACCHAISRISGRKCDLAVFQLVRSEKKSSDHRCFLFSCVNATGDDVCVTSYNRDYVVFKSKPAVIESQLLDIASTTVQSPQISDSPENDDCQDHFSVKTGFIIKTNESIRKGAIFLKVSKDSNTLDSCQNQCCMEKSSSRHCDLVIFHERLEDSEDSHPRCYLFSCTDNKGNFLCVTSPNNDFSVAVRKHNDLEKGLHDIIVPTTLSSTIISTSPVMTQTSVQVYSPSTTIPVTSTSTISPTTTTKKIVPMTTTSASSTSSTTSIATMVSKSTSCQRLMWQCDNKDCIKVTDVCNGKFDCSDKSDEMGCQLLQGSLTDKSVVSQSKPVAISSLPNTMSHELSSAALTSSALDPEWLGKVNERTEPEKGAVLPLALGLSVTLCVLIMVLCRVRSMKKKLRRRGKHHSMEESDYLINGMYL